MGFEIIQAQNWKTKNIESLAKKLQNWNLKFWLILSFEQPGLPMFTPHGFNLFFHFDDYFRLCEEFGRKIPSICNGRDIGHSFSFACGCLSGHFGCVMSETTKDQQHRSYWEEYNILFYAFHCRLVSNFRKSIHNVLFSRVAKQWKNRAALIHVSVWTDDWCVDWWQTEDPAMLFVPLRCAMKGFVLT